MMIWYEIINPPTWRNTNTFNKTVWIKCDLANKMKWKEIYSPLSLSSVPIHLLLYHPADLHCMEAVGNCHYIHQISLWIYPFFAVNTIISNFFNVSPMMTVSTQSQECDKIHWYFTYFSIPVTITCWNISSKEDLIAILEI